MTIEVRIVCQTFVKVALSNANCARGEKDYISNLDLRLHVKPGNIYEESNFSCHYNIMNAIVSCCEQYFILFLKIVVIKFLLLLRTL